MSHVYQKESTYLLVILQGSSVCPDISAFLLPIHYRGLAACYSPFFFFFSRAHIDRHFQNSLKMMVPPNRETHYRQIDHC